MNNLQYVTNTIKSIAVLPFINMSTDPENEYFSDGITEEIINALTTIKGLKVIARTSSFEFKNKNVDVRKIGSQLGISTILEGSVRKSNNRVRITAQLIRTDDGSHLWSNTFDRELVDIFVLEDEISLAIADEIRNNFGHFEVQEHLIKQPTSNVDAYQHFLKGRSLQLRWSPESLNQAISYYDQAIALDKNYAKAYYANLQCYGLLGMWGFMPQQEAMELAIGNLLIAKEIDTKLPEYPLSFVGRFFWGEWDYKNAYVHINKVLAINPNHIDGLEAMAELCIALGFFDHAMIYAKKLLEVDPLSANNHYTLAHIYYYEGKFDKSLESINYALTLNPELDLAHHLKCFCLIWLNHPQEFKTLIQDTPLQEEKNLLFRVINDEHAKVSDQLIAQWAERDKKEPMIVPYDVYILCNSGDKERSFAQLKDMIGHRRGQIINYRHEPLLQALHEIPGFSDLHHSNLSLADISLPKDNEKKQSSNILDDEQVRNLKEKLQAYFEEEKPFLNSQLSLNNIAEVLEINTNKVSYLVNTAFNQNFNDFVNQYRLNHFKAIALDPKNSHLTILGLAYDSGFNSKSVFNTYFKKSEGVTPSKWVKS